MNAPTSLVEPLAKQAYSVQEVAEILGVSSDKVYELIRGNVIPHKRLGRRIIVPAKPFDAWLNNSDSWESFGTL